MATRATERRIPAGYDVRDFGESSGDASAALISFHASPVVTGRRQTYVVFVLDAAMQANVESYRWQVGTDSAQSTNGVFEYVPAEEGDIQLTIDLLDAGNTALKSLSLSQEVVALNPELESMMQQAEDVTPVVADPETSRELVNDVRGYIDELAPRSADANSSLNRLIFALAYAEALHVPPPERATQSERLAAALQEGASASFAAQAERGIGLCQIRPQILGMYVGTTATGSDRLIPPRELPRDESARRAARNELRTALEQLDPSLQADLFNLLRFPKSNLRMTVLLVEALRAQYFAGEALSAILPDEDHATSLIDQFKDGPFAMS